MRQLFILFIFSSLLLGAQEEEKQLPHPAAGFCKAMNVDIYGLGLSKKDQDAIFFSAQQYLKAHTMALQEDKTTNTFWIAFETLISGVSSKQCYELIKLLTDIEEGKNKDQAKAVDKQLQSIKFSIAKLQRGEENQKRFAWMLAYALNQLSWALKPEDFADYNVLFAMVDQNVPGMNWRAVQQKKFIPSIITARISKGTPLPAGGKLKEQTEFLTSNKAAIRTKASIKQLYTVSEDSGEAKVSVEEIKSSILEGRSHRSTSFDFDIGLSLTANVSFGEVLSFLSTRYPYLEPYKEVIFSVPEHINDDSSSSGLGLSLLLMSMYEGVEIDPNIVSCADISVNGNILPAFDMTEKIKKAASMPNSVVLISIDDYMALMDAFIIWGHSAVWGAQVIAVRDMSEAIDFARKDKSKDYLLGISEFREIQTLLRRSPQNLIANRKKVVAKLVSVLRKIPTHASAKALHSILNGKKPSELSINTSLDLFTKTCRPVLREMFEGKTASAVTKNACSARLQQIDKGLNKSISPLVTAMQRYIMKTKTKSPTEEDKTAFLREWNDLSKNRKFVDRMRR